MDQLEQPTTAFQQRDSTDAVHASAAYRDLYFLFKPALQVALDGAEGQCTASYPITPANWLCPTCHTTCPLP